jgi:hypothetical protein
MLAAAHSQYLVDLLSQVPDPRSRRGIRHPLGGLLAMGIAAVVAGSRSFAAIGQRAADAGGDVLAALGAARGAPDETTFRRAFAPWRTASARYSARSPRTPRATRSPQCASC